MYLIRLFITLLMVPYFIFHPSVYGSTNARGEMLYQRIVDSAEKKMEFVIRKLPPGNLLLVQSEKEHAVKEEILKKISEFKAASNAELALFKKELIRLNETELGTMRSELQGYLNAATDSELAELGKFIYGQVYYEDASMEYLSSFTSIEKKNAIRNALMKDLGFLRSIYNKRIGMASKEELIKDLNKNIKIFEAQQSGKADNKKILQISLMVLAGVAVLTWGISSAVYGARLGRVRSDREAKLAQLQSDLAAQYQAYKAELTNKELEFLNANGYIRTVCGNYSQPDSIICNRYNYGLFSGTKYCTVYCMKNSETGKETLHEPPICTSPFIPGDCYNPQEYWDAYSRGDRDGYSDGQTDGYYDGRDDGRYDGRRRGEDDGYTDGYADGYDDGYADGYASGQWNSSKSLSRQPRSQGYLRGFQDGIEQYKILFLNY